MSGSRVAPSTGNGLSISLSEDREDHSLMAAHAVLFKDTKIPLGNAEHLDILEGKRPGMPKSVF